MKKVIISQSIIIAVMMFFLFSLIIGNELDSSAKDGVFFTCVDLISTLLPITLLGLIVLNIIEFKKKVFHSSLN